MALRGGARRALRALGPSGSYNPALKYGTAAIVGGSLAAGAISGVMDESGPYGTMQEDIFGDRGALRRSFRAGLTTSFSNRSNIYGTTDYYYGAPHSPSARRSQMVPGDIVFGQYNLRR